MMWSEKELANFSIVSANVIMERVYKHIDDPDNIDIFNKENFSYLWGMLGVAGIKGFPHSALDKLWQSLKENDVIEAFDKGVLGDFNKFHMEKYSDNRLRSWLNLDNFLADQKFKKMILMPLVAINRDYAHQVDMQAFNPVRVVGVLERYPLSEPVKQMLIDMQGHGAACGISGKEVVEQYEKEKVLTRLCDIIAHSKRKFNEYEKDFLFRYIYDAVIDGFDFGLIGLNDLVFEKLMADETDDRLSELELVPLRERNIEIVEFAKKFDEKYGFFELTAAKLIKNNPLNITGMIERCLRLMDKTDPKGIVFALELVNLKQLKSAAKILIALARKGRATELVSFLHRLLPEANGSEMMIMSILKLNLKTLKEREFFNLDDVFREYPARIYVIGINQFIEYGFYKEAATLLNELIIDGWIDGFDDLRLKCRDFINILIDKNNALVEGLKNVASKINLEVYEVDGTIYVGDVKDNPISLLRKNAEDTILNVTGDDVKNITEKVSFVEEVTYNAIEGIKNIFEKVSNKDKNDEINFDITSYGDEFIEQIEDDKKNLEFDVINENIKDEIEVKEDVAIESDSNVDVNLVDDIVSWREEQNIDDKSEGGEDEIKGCDVGIFNIDEKEIESHFEKIKNMASVMIDKAEQKASEIIKRVESQNIECSNGLEKIKKLKDKFTFFKKK